jgi:hypothetical protein
MRRYFYAMTLLAWSSIGFGLQQPGPAPVAPKMDGVVNLGGLKSRAPADWMEEKPDNPACYKQYWLEPVNDDKYPGQVTVCLVGTGKGQTAQDHVSRWKNMFLPPEGETIQQAAQVRQLNVNGAKATYLDIRGDLKGIPGDNSSPRENFRLLGVYLNTPKGPYVIRMLGPDGTVRFYRSEFEQWVKAFKQGGLTVTSDK